MMADIEIEHKIWQLSTKGQRTKEEWLAIVDYLVKRLEDYLQQQIEIIDKKIEALIIDEEAISCSIRSAVSFGGLLALAWEGRLGMELVEGKPYVSALLFLFSQNKRLAVVGQEASYIQLVYEQSDSSEGFWRYQGWLEDVYGEFEDIDEYETSNPVSLDSGEVSKKPT